MSYIRNKYNAYPKAVRQKPKTVDWNALELKDLKKLENLYENHILQKNIYLTNKSEIDVLNKDVRRNNVLDYQLNQIEVENRIEPLNSQLRQIQQKLEQCKVGLVSQLLGDTVGFNGNRYKRIPGELLLKQREEICNRIKDIKKNGSSFKGGDCLPEPTSPTNEKIVKLGATKNKVDLDNIDIHKLRAQITYLEAKDEKEKQRLDELKARATASEKETRQQAQKFKRDLHKQMAKVSGCPYCAGPLGENNAHLDHIHPVSEGGRSTEKNLIFVCAKCNLIKKAQTLRSFLKKTGFNQEAVYEKLELLNKFV